MTANVAAMFLLLQLSDSPETDVTATFNASDVTSRAVTSSPDNTTSRCVGVLTSSELSGRLTPARRRGLVLQTYSSNEQNTASVFQTT